jgi:hypothetical protein
MMLDIKNSENLTPNLNPAFLDYLAHYMLVTGLERITHRDRIS